MLRFLQWTQFQSLLIITILFSKIIIEVVFPQSWWTFTCFNHGLHNNIRMIYVLVPYSRQSQKSCICNLPSLFSNFELNQLVAPSTSQPYKFQRELVEASSTPTSSKVLLRQCSFQNLHLVRHFSFHIFQIIFEQLTCFHQNLFLLLWQLYKDLWCFWTSFWPNNFPIASSFEGKFVITSLISLQFSSPYTITKIGVFHPLNCDYND